ncbi:MAG TPA: SIR2 family protein [Thermoanaerobaculia bacterium]|jgi:hypothetical protein|nr:SIR2 family protein [Thermoanaerobaculia bacterium]
MRKPLSLNNLHEELKKFPKATDDDGEVMKSSLAYIKERLLVAMDKGDIGWDSFLTFWPPRMLQALQDNKLACFFGAGLSMPSGLPSWSDMLRDYFGLDQAVLTDDDLKSDPLTQAELASHRLGADKVQSLLREKLTSNKYEAATSHYLAAALRLPFYVTTNYDTIFKKAWEKLNTRIDLVELTSDIDTSKLWPDGKPVPSPTATYLFKIHGCLDKPTEHLILTRSDYRRHYRSNDNLFSCVRYLLTSYHILFLGFSHKDPEVTRLVEDAIWKFEEGEERRRKDPSRADAHSVSRPHFYSLQFHMSSHTPEIFAARGIVALNPPLADPAAKDVRSSSLARALADLMGAAETGLAGKVSLDSVLEDYCGAVTSDLKRGLDLLDSYKEYATQSLKATAPADWMENLRHDLSDLGGQGVYLINDEGALAHVSAADGLTNPARKVGPEGGFSKRPYFQQAKTYRAPFVSDCFKSVFNDNLTFALCLPLIDDKGFAGLLFSACQPGAWMTPLAAAKSIWMSRPSLSILVVDANGVAVIPPNGEFEPEESGVALEKGETRGQNFGFPYRKLLALSRRNKLIERIMENVIPLRQDDDVLPLGSDLRQYTVVTETPLGRWKIGISDSVFLSGRL